MDDSGGTAAPGRRSRRVVALTVAAGLVVVVWSLAVMMANGAASQAVSANARQLHWTNAVLGSAAVSRAGNAQAVVFAVDHRLEVASDRALEAAISEAENTLDALTTAAAARPAGHESVEVDEALAQFVESYETVLTALDSGEVELAVAFSQDEFEASYRQLESTLVTEQTRLAQVIDQSEGTIARVASLAGILVTLLIPAAGLVAYFLVARRQMRERSIAMEAELEAAKELSRAKDEFIASLSHELRTPLTSIYGFSEVLLESALSDPGQARELITLINSASADLWRMVEDLLAAARVDAGALSFELTPISILAEIDSVAEPYRRAGVPISVACPPIAVMADRMRLRQVIRNLVANAQRHGGPSIRIEAGIRDQMMVMAVIDDGPGVPHEIEERLFERFVHDGRGALLAGSVGLGLSVARLLVEAMGGSVEYHRVDGHTVFSVIMPVASEPEDASTSSLQPARRVTSGIPAPSLGATL